MTTRTIKQFRARIAKRQRHELVQLEKTRQVAHGAWEGAMSGVMQLSGDTAEERTYNVAQLETLLDAWRAFCRIYGTEIEIVQGWR